ncbi:MAG TPA: aminoglycoside phosphotransferase, partial [Thiotrichales bacterium]|nr:aminoglycoside phosphotransferase [Thiotrichales bacterium]
NFGFLDFSTLQKRREYCEQELRLNRRLADAIYLEVVSICGPADKPHLAATGEVIEYAVKMKQFPQSAQLDNRLAAGKLTLEQMDAIARRIADFHQGIPVADAADDYGSADLVYQPVRENFVQITQHLPGPALTGHGADSTVKNDERVAVLSVLQQWSEATFESLSRFITQRRNDGFVRECHGDMHLRNMLWLDDQPMAFDCIEFNPALRWIDVISEIAFLVMDLQDRRQPQLASRFLNSYLEATGDYAGLKILRFYLCYRAMVRAKVDVLRLSQPGMDRETAAQVVDEFDSYLDLATGYIQPGKPELIIMRGVSASGKSTVSQQLVDALGFIRIRSDVERKRLFAPSITAKAGNAVGEGIYTAAASDKTYATLLALAGDILDAGFSVIIDAAFLKPEQRSLFQSLAEKKHVPYSILETTAPPAILQQRIRARKNDVSDADLTVLENQLANWQVLTPAEQAFAVSVDTSGREAVNAFIQEKTRPLSSPT